MAMSSPCPPIGCETGSMDPLHVDQAMSPSALGGPSPMLSNQAGNNASSLTSKPERKGAETLEDRNIFMFADFAPLRWGLPGFIVCYKRASFHFSLLLSSLVDFLTFQLVKVPEHTNSLSLRENPDLVD